MELFAGETTDWTIPNIKVGGALLTAANPPTTFTWQVQDKNGTVTALTGSMVETTPLGTWAAQFNWSVPPADSYRVVAVMTKGSTRREWRKRLIQVEA